MRQSQSGVALIAVLLFLILITIAGVVAVRQSSVDLRVATSDQAEALMINSSDSVLASIEQAASSGGENLASHSKSVFGHFLLRPQDTVGDQVTFCYRPNNPALFNLMQSRILRLGGGTMGSNDAICSSSRKADYVSARNTVMNQVSITGLESETEGRFVAATLGEQMGVSDVEAKPRISMQSVSVIPTLSDKGDSEINTCFGYPVGNDPQAYSNSSDQNLQGCFRRNGVPSTILVEDGLIDDDVVGARDTEEGGFGQDLCQNDPLCSGGASK